MSTGSSTLPSDSLRESALVTAPPAPSRVTPAPRPEAMLVPPIVAWLVQQRAGPLARIAPSIWWPGLILSGGAAFLWILGSFAGLSTARQLGLVPGDDHLPAALEGHPALLAVRVQRAGTGDAHARLERTRRVVDPGVDDAAVATGLPGGDLRGALEHHRGAVRAAARQLPRDRQSEDPAPDDSEVALARRGPHLSPPASAAPRAKAARGRRRVRGRASSGSCRR